MKTTHTRSAATISIASAALACVAVCLLSWLAYSSGQTAKQERRARYELNVRDKRGHWMGLLCHQEPYGNEYEFSLNQAARSFTDVRLSGDKAIDSKDPVLCRAWPFEKFDIAQRASAAAKSPPASRVVVIGDSWAYGESVPLGDSFPELMNLLLARHGNSRRASVINLARSGLLLPAVYAQAFPSALALKPQTIILAWSISSMPAAWTLEDTNTAKPGVPPSQSYKFRLPKNLDPQSADALAFYAKKMQTAATAAGSRFIVLILPAFSAEISQRRDSISINKTAARALQSAGVRALDFSNIAESQAGPASDTDADPGSPDVSAHFNTAVKLINELRLADKIITPETYSPSRPASPLNAARNQRPSVPQNNFSRFTFFFTSALLALLALSFVSMAPEIARLITREQKHLAVFAILIPAAALAIRFLLSPRSHITYLDEFDRYRIILAWLQGKYGAVTADNVPGSMLPHFFAYKALGASPAAGYALTAALCSASSLLLYATIRLLWKNPWNALLTAAFLATAPLNIRYSASHSIDPINVFFLLAALFAAALDLQSSNLKSRLFLAAAASFALFVRIDNFVFIWLLLLMRASAALPSRFAFEQTYYKSVLNRVYPRENKLAAVIPLSIIAASICAFAAYLCACLSSTPQSAHITGILKNISVNLPGNVVFFFNNGLTPLAATILAAAGAAAAFRSREQNKTRFNLSVFLAAWIISYFAVHLASAAGGYETARFRDTARYANHYLPALAFFAAAGISCLYAIIPSPGARAAASSAAISYLLLSPLNFHTGISRYGEFMTINRTIVNAAPRFLPSAMFYTNSPLVQSSLQLDAGASASLINSPDSAPQSCPARECVFVFYTRNKTSRLYRPAMDCLFRFTAGPSGNLYYCGPQAARAMPPDIWNDPDANLITGIPPTK